jgi:predicted RNase H-like HicB family nuclease
LGTSFFQSRRIALIWNKTATIAGTPGVDALPGCTIWGYTREEALKSLRDAVELYADAGVEAIGEALSMCEIRDRRDRIVPLPS